MRIPVTEAEKKLAREAVEGAVDEDGDIVWFILPSLLRPRRDASSVPSTGPQDPTISPSAPPRN